MSTKPEEEDQRVVISDLRTSGFTALDIQDFIESLDQEFVPPIGQKVSIASYA